MHPAVAEQLAPIILEDHRREARAYRTHRLAARRSVRDRLARGLITLGHRMAVDVPATLAADPDPGPTGRQLACC